MFTATFVLEFMFVTDPLCSNFFTNKATKLKLLFNALLTELRYSFSTKKQEINL